MSDKSDMTFKAYEDLLAGLGEETKKALRMQISKFANQGGVTLGDVMSVLPLSQDIAVIIATTEITKAFAKTEQTKGEQLKKEFDDVPVIKTWFTNNDDKVCEICAPLNGKKVLIDQEFTDGVYMPPAHVGCRCWMSSRTNILWDENTE